MKILIADDNKDFCTTLAEIVESLGYQTEIVFSPDSAISFINHNHKQIQLLMLDIEFGPNVSKNGLDILEYTRKNHHEIPAIMISGKGTIETAVRATKLGAINFIEKSVISKKLIQDVLASSIDRFSGNSELKEILSFLNMNGIIGKSSKILEVGDKIHRFGRTELNILVTGETGTGKKLVAKALHSVSRRNRFPFITVDIPNIPHDLFQSELFGHLKGSFSGAIENKKGLFQQANKGTLFLDEIGDLSLDLQANLLLPIEDRTIRKIGSVETEEVDIRFISATDKDLADAISNQKFREQLFHRLRECEINIPPLRERIEDIPEICDYFIKNHNNQFNEEKYFAPTAIEFLQEQKWPGNIRELASTLKVVLQTTRKDSIEHIDFSKVLSNPTTKTKTSSSEPIISNERTLKEDIEQVDKRKIESMLEMCRGNVSKSAAQLGVSRETLHNKIRKYEIDITDYRNKK